jgi:lipoate-protein ligase A
LAQALGVDDASDLVEFTRVAGAMRRGFEQALNLELQPGALTTEEVRRSALLIRTQFGNNAWNRQR